MSRWRPRRRGGPLATVVLLAVLVVPSLGKQPPGQAGFPSSSDGRLAKGGGQGGQRSLRASSSRFGSKEEVVQAKKKEETATAIREELVRPAGGSEDAGIAAQTCPRNAVFDPCAIDLACEVNCLDSEMGTAAKPCNRMCHARCKCVEGTIKFQTFCITLEECESIIAAPSPAAKKRAIAEVVSVYMEAGDEEEDDEEETEEVGGGNDKKNGKKEKKDKDKPKKEKKEKNEKKGKKGKGAEEEEDEEDPAVELSLEVSASLEDTVDALDAVVAQVTEALDVGGVGGEEDKSLATSEEGVVDVSVEPNGAMGR